MLAGTLEISMLANMARLQADMTKTKGMVGNAMTSVERSVNMAKRALGALGIGLSAIVFTRLIKGALDSQDELSKLSQKVGVSVEGLVGLKHAASLSGLQFEGLQKAIKSVSTQMFDASMGLAESKRNFAALGIEIKGTDGSLKSAEKIIVEVADKFAAMNDGTLKSALAVKLFGKAGLDMIPMLNQGSAALAQMVAEGQKLNPTTTESAKKAEIFNDIMNRLTKSVGSVAMSMLNDLLPTLVKVSDKMWEAQRRGEGFWGTMITGLQTFLTGDDAHKLNVQIADTTEKLLRLQDIGDALRRRPVNPMNLQLLEANKKAIEDTRVALQNMIAIKPILAPEDPAAAGRRGGGGVVPVDDATLKAQRKLAEEQAVEMARIAMADLADYEETLRFRSNMDAEQAAEAERIRQDKLEQIREFHANERKLVQAGAEYDMQILRERADAAERFEQQRRDQMVNTWQLGAELLTAFAGKSKAAAIAVIAINKALAIAQTIQNTAVAVMRAFAELGPIAGAPVAAAMKTMGAIQVGLIAATGLVQASNVGGGGAAAGTPANPLSVQPVGSSSQASGPGRGQTTIVNLYGNTYTRSQVRELLEAQNENSVDGSRTVVVER